MTDTLTAGEKLDRALAEKPGHEDLAQINGKLDAVLQAVQNLAGRVDELSKQVARR